MRHMGQHGTDSALVDISTGRDRITPVNRPEINSLVYAILEASPQHDSAMACGHAYGSMTPCVWGGLLWNKAFVKDPCLRPSCLISFSRR